MRAVMTSADYYRNGISGTSPGANVVASRPEPQEVTATALTLAKAAADPIREGATLIMPVQGPLSPKGSYGGTSTDRLTQILLEAGDDSKVGAVILHIMSPGGLVFGNAEAGDAIFAVRAKKPIVGVASPYAFSAAHWLATQCSAFYASTSGEVGSVGVRGGHVDVSGFEDKIGMKTTLIASSPEKIAGHPYGPLSEEDRAELQAEIDACNQTFVAAIARGRGIEASAVPGIHGEGRTFSAAKAARAGVTDGTMTLREAIAKYSSSRSRLDLMRRRAEVQGILFLRDLVAAVRAGWEEVTRGKTNEQLAKGSPSSNEDPMPVRVEQPAGEPVPVKET